MRPEIDIMGVFVPTLMVLVALAYGLYFLLHRMLSALGAYRYIWHPALFDIALYFVVLGAAGYVLELSTP